MKRVRDVRVGEKLWTLHEGRLVQTTLAAVQTRKTRELVEVETDAGTLQATQDHPFATPGGWMEAGDLAGQAIEWTKPRSLCRTR